MEVLCIQEVPQKFHLDHNLIIFLAILICNLLHNNHFAESVYGSVPDMVYHPVEADMVVDETVTDMVVAGKEVGSAHGR